MTLSLRPQLPKCYSDRRRRGIGSNRLVSWGAPSVRLTATMVPHPRRRPHSICTGAPGAVFLLDLSSQQLAGALVPPGAHQKRWGTGGSRLLPASRLGPSGLPTPGSDRTEKGTGDGCGISKIRRHLLESEPRWTTIYAPLMSEKLRVNRTVSNPLKQESLPTNSQSSARGARTKAIPRRAAMAPRPAAAGSVSGGPCTHIAQRRIWL
jgi:hypothetical protein